MQVTGTNNINGSYCCMPPNQVQNQPVQNAQQLQAQPPVCVNPPQTVQVPSSSGVNIQIFNPSIAAPGAPAPTYNVNSPNYYPPNYYTDNLAQNCTCSACAQADGKNSSTSNADSGKNDVNSSNVNGGQNSNPSDNNKSDNVNTNSENNSAASTTITNSDKKTEKKKVVELTDQYIMNLESYLNSQDREIRLNAAKEVYARLEEDPSRKDDRALTALTNKMLQDPDAEVRMLALAALDGRYCTGDDYTVNLLKDMQSKPDGYGQDAVDAAEILLKMSARQVEKEVETDPARQRKVTTKKEETKKA